MLGARFLHINNVEVRFKILNLFSLFLLTTLVNIRFPKLIFYLSEIKMFYFLLISLLYIIHIKIQRNMHNNKTKE